MESHASISADGQRIAFVGQYEGPSEVYVMPIDGGTPKRLTYEEGNPIVYSPDGEWLIEGWGVEPDMKVDNMPYESFKGKDAQLDAAVQYLIKLNKEQPVILPPIPKYPIKAFDYKDK